MVFMAMRVMRVIVTLILMMIITMLTCCKRVPMEENQEQITGNMIYTRAPQRRHTQGTASRVVVYRVPSRL